MLTAAELQRVPLEELFAALARTDATTIQVVEAMLRAALALSHRELSYDEQRHVFDFLVELAAAEGARRW
jgi:hypothetical protein